MAWSRYLVSFQMELADKKCRPSGSPPKDSSFLNLHLRICAFPTHSTGCKFADYFQRCAHRASLLAAWWSLTPLPSCCCQLPSAVLIQAVIVVHGSLISWWAKSTHSVPCPKLLWNKGKVCACAGIISYL